MWPINNRRADGANSRGALEITRKQILGSGYKDADLISRSSVEGGARLYTEGWGENRAPHLMHEVFAARDVNESLLGREMDRERSKFEEQLERLLPEILCAEHDVVMALDVLERHEIRRDQLTALFDEKGMRTPAFTSWQHAAKAALVGLLAVGELVILGPAFQVLGLADAPLVPFLPFTLQHLAALSSVTALFILAHSLGARRPEQEVGGAGSMKTSGPTGMWSGFRDTTRGNRVLLAGIAFLLLGLAAVRELYLQKTESSDLGTGVGFLALNVGLVVAACLVSRLDDGPHSAQWRIVMKEIRVAGEIYQNARGDYEAQVGDYNALVVARELLLSQYGHALDAGHHDAERQVQLIAGQTRLEQPEFVTERMFDLGQHPDGLHSDQRHSIRKDLWAYLVDDSATEIPLRSYPRIDQKRVTDRRVRREERAGRTWVKDPVGPAGPIDPVDLAGPVASSPADPSTADPSTVDLNAVSSNGSQPAGPHLPARTL